MHQFDLRHVALFPFLIFLICMYAGIDRAIWYLVTVHGLLN